MYGITLLQEFGIGYGMKFGICTTNILKNSDLGVIVKKKGISDGICLTEDEALQLFITYPTIRSIIGACEIQGTLSIIIHQSNLRLLYVKVDCYVVNNIPTTQWSLVVALANGAQRVYNITLVFLRMLYSVNDLLAHSLQHWHFKRYTLSIMSILGIREGPQTLKEQCKWAILNNGKSNELISPEVLKKLPPDLIDYLHIWSTRDHMLGGGNCAWWG